MALTWEFKEPLIELDGFSVDTIVGSFPVGTYDFKAIVCDVGEYFRRGVTRESPPIYVTGVTFNGSQGGRFTVNWNASHIEGQRVFIWFKLSTASWQTSGTGCLLQNGSYSHCYHQNPDTIRDVETNTYGSNYMSTVSEVYAEPYSFAKDKGCGVIEVSGSFNNTNFITVLKDMEVQGLANTDISFWNGGNHFAGYWGIRVVNGASGELDFSFLSLWVWGFDMGSKVTDGRNYTIKIGGGNTDEANIMVPPYAGSGQFLILYNTKVLSSTISQGTAGFPSRGMASMQIWDYDTQYINSKIHVAYPIILATNTYQNSIIFANALRLKVNVQEYIEPVTLLGILRIDYNHYDSWFKDFKLFQNVGSSMIDYRNNYNYDGSFLKFCDCTFNSMIDNEIITTTDYPQMIYWRYLSRGYNSHCYIEHTVKATVQDINGNPFENETVNIYDKNNDLCNTATTDENGEIEVYVKTRDITSVGIVDGTDPAYTNIENLYPIKIEILKSGYDTYTEILSTLTEKLNTIVSLIKTTPPIYYQQELQGIVSTSDVKGTIDDSEISGVITTENITGEITETEIYSNINSNSIEGNVK